MTILEAAASQVAKSLLPSTPSQLVGRRRGVVIAVNASPPSVDVALGTTTLPGVRYLASYAPVAGDNVFVDFTGPDPLVLGETAAGDTAVSDRALLRVGNTYVGSHPVHSASTTPSSNWASMGHWDRQGTSDYAFMQNAEGRTLVNASAGQSIGLYIGGSSKAGINSAGEFNVGSALLRHYPSDTTYIELKHSSSSRYQVLMRNDGNTYLDCGSGASSYVRCNGSGRFQAGPSYASMWEAEVFGSIHMRDNWVRSHGQFGWYSQTYGGGVWMNDTAWVKAYGGKGFYADNEIRALDAMIHRWNGSGSHAVFNQKDSGWAKGYMARWDQWLWIMTDGRCTWRLGGYDSFWVANSGGYCDMRATLPVLGGAGMIYAGSGQFGSNGSGRALKNEIEPLARAVDQPGGAHTNPVWSLRPVKFWWDPEKVQNADDVNRWLPDGQSGFIAEEVAEVAPDAVTRDLDGNPVSLNDWAFLAYLVAGVQHCHDGLKRRVAKEAELTQKVAALEAALVKVGERLGLIEAVPVIAVALKKKG